MVLPFDPHELDPDDFGEKETFLEMGHEAAIEHVREVCEGVGFGVPVEFSASSLLNEKIDAGRDPYYVLGACNPAMADRALTATDGDIGALFPCNMIVEQVGPDRQRVYHVSIMKIARLLGMPVDDEAMDDIVEETGAMVEEAFENFTD